ncbi:MAG: GNAT family N-acetyltransferase [Porticoccaceae bacterium]|nr:GNAT family N-acetyltransferase [Porticoccaceae bacterium]
MNERDKPTFSNEEVAAMESVDFFSIDVEQTNWQTSGDLLASIRRPVFIDEQGVPEAEEFDAEDESAVHWVAYGPNEEVMGCARLAGDKIGRMAVSAEHRNKGVGSALMRRIIAYAAHIGLASVQLNSQIHALPFYEGMHFEADGDEFMDAGIPHIHMSLSLIRFLSPAVQPPLPDISAEQRDRVPLDGTGPFQEYALNVLGVAERQVRILSSKLDPNIYDSAKFCEQLFQFTKLHPYAEVQILVRDAHLLVQDGHRLMHLYHRLPSHIEIRTLKPSTKTLHTEFMVVDHHGILYRQTADRYIGYAILYSPLEAKKLAGDFVQLWEASEPDPELRSLPI